MRAAISFLSLALLGLAAPSFAQQAEDLEQLTRAEAEARDTEARLRAERETVAAEIASLKTELARDTAQTQAFERESLRLSNSLAESTETLSDLQQDLAANRDETQALFASLQRLQMAPNAATLADPDDAVRTAQAATMIDLLSRALQDKAQRIVELAEQIDAARQVTLVQQEELEANNAELLRRKERTERLVAEKERLHSSIQTEEEKARNTALRLAAEARDLRELLARVVAVPETVTPRLKPELKMQSDPDPLPPGTVSFAEAKGGMIRPVSGTMTEGFGRASKGQTYNARAGGQVIAPYAGRVEFVGPFRTYGRVVILNMDDGYYLLLTGLGQTYVSTNEKIRRGEPVGSMPGTRGRSPLYIELRRNGRSIDPEPWMGGRGRG